MTDSIIDADTETTDKAMRRIRALLATAEDGSGATDAERDLAAQRAAELMAKHAIRAAMLDATRPTGDDLMEDRKFHLPNPYHSQKRLLLGVVLSAMSCKGVLIEGQVIHVFGRRSDLDRVDVLFSNLLLQAINLAMRQRTNGTASQTRSFRANWLLGFATRISERMDEGKAAAVAEAAEEQLTSEGAELVLASRRAAADAAAGAAYERRRSIKRRQVTNARGYYAGHEAGSRADIGQSRVGGRRVAIGS